MATSKVYRVFGGEERAFQLRYGEALELERLRNKGLELMFRSMGGTVGNDDIPDDIALLLGGAGDYRIEDVAQTIRLGLEGGGMKPNDAAALVQRYVKDVPDWLNNVRLATVIIGAFLAGVPDEPVGKPQGEGEPQENLSPADECEPPTSTG
jgi:hypothetical protein